MSRFLPLLALAGLLSACAKDAPADTAEPADDLCAQVDGPVTWDNFGRSFTTQYCQGCHNGQLAKPDRQDAPVAVTFDTQEETVAQAERILVRAAGEVPTMPPQGGVPEDDRLLLEVWLRCWAE